MRSPRAAHPTDRTADRYGRVAMLLHWTIAAAIIGLLAAGTLMVRLEPGSSLQFTLYQAHKSLGITVLALGVVRLIWRLTHRPPPLPATLRPWEALLARLTHGGFYVLMLAMPISGWLMISASAWNFPTVIFGAFTLPHLPVPGTPEERKAIEDALKDVHEILAFGMVGLLVLHVAGALKHQFILRDDTLWRMLPGRRRRAREEDR